jgi:hypothetical protein
LEKKLVNLLIFTDLAKMKKKIPEDFSGVKRIQDRRVRRLVRKAYRIPFYKERFDAAGVKPEDIRTGADLTRLPLLHKEELRAWMKEEAKNPRYDNWYHDTTSGSSGEPLMILLSPREKAYMMANWFRVMMLAGYNPFLGKTMSRKSAHSVSAGYDTALQRLGILRRGFLDQYAPEEEMIRQVNEYKPDFLYMNKTELMRLCLYCRQHSSKIYQPKFFVPTGEKNRRHRPPAVQGGSGTRHHRLLRNSRDRRLHGEDRREPGVRGPQRFLCGKHLRRQRPTGRRWQDRGNAAVQDRPAAD